ncbi:MAG: histidine kinase [Ferruginibacter sp.]
MEQAKKRYPFLTVFVVVLVLNLFFSLLSLFVLFLVGSDESASELNEFLTRDSLLRKTSNIIFLSVFYYFTLNYFNKLMVEKKATGHYLRVSVAMVVIVFIYLFSLNYFSPQEAIMDGKKRSLGILIFSFVTLSIFYTMGGLLLAYLNNLRDEKKQRKILEAQKMQLEVDKSHANFKFLKSQINPHFLHNTLNFLYAKSLPYSAELSEGILTLSDIMRYALNEATGSDDKAPLKDEIEHVRNVIKINQLRFSNNLHVNFEVKGVVNGVEVIPFLLITVVENAFKHGDLQRVEFPIEVKLAVEHNCLYFYCRNKKKTGPKEMSTGLGLDNIRNRLDFAYGKNYKFIIKDEADFYTTELIIDKL